MALLKVMGVKISRYRSESGAAAIEFALGTLILLPLIAGTVDLGLAGYAWIQVNNLVEAEALYVAKNATALYEAYPFDPAVITNAAGSASGVTLTPAPSRFCGCPASTGVTSKVAFAAPPADPCSGTCSGIPASAYIQVSASYAYEPILPVSWWTSNPTFTATALVKIH